MVVGEALIFQVDAFTSRRFAGNPAAVVVLGAYPADDDLQAVAAENNCAETAFLVRAGGDYRVRWFTPVLEVPPDPAAVALLDRPGVIVTAAGDGQRFDIVSRYFAPRKGIPEDPVTGAAHCMLAPYWSPRLGLDTLRAYQASARGGELQCRPRGDRVAIWGSCVFYLEGRITI